MTAQNINPIDLPANDEPLTIPFAIDGNSTVDTDPPTGPGATDLSVNGASDITDTSASQQYGFPYLNRIPIGSGGKPPKGLDMNNAFYTYSNYIMALTAGVAFSFSQQVSDNLGGYPQNAILCNPNYVDAAGNTKVVFFRNTIANNTNVYPNSPTDADNDWVMYNIGDTTNAPNGVIIGGTTELTELIETDGYFNIIANITTIEAYYSYKTYSSGISVLSLQFVFGDITPTASNGILAFHLYQFLTYLNLPTTGNKVPSLVASAESNDEGGSEIVFDPFTYNVQMATETGVSSTPPVDSVRDFPIQNGNFNSPTYTYCNDTFKYLIITMQDNSTSNSQHLYIDFELTDNP